jgi:hypothetical protein
MSGKLVPNAILHFSGMIKADDESARIELNLKDASEVTDLIGAIAKEFIIHVPAGYSKFALEKLKTYLDMTKGTTVVYLEIPSKEDPKKLHLIKTGKRILLHKALIEYIENTMPSAWSFK